MYLTVSLEFSEDDLTVSNASASYTAVTTSLLEATWRSGIQREGDDPTPGSATFVLLDQSRNFEPDYVAGTFYPNIVPERRFRLKIDSASVTYSEGIWFAQEWQPSWPGGVTVQETTVTCGDGFAPLALDDLPTMDPPDAQSYADVVMSDEPWGYWTLGDPPGTQASAMFRRAFRGKGKNRRRVKLRHGTRYDTASEVGGTVGATGIYKRLPLLGQPGAIVGESGTSVLFTGTTGTTGNYCRVNLDDTATFSDSNEITVGCWVYVNSVANGPIVFVRGPNNASSSPIWMLGMEFTGADGFYFAVNTGTTAFERAETGVAATTGVWTHVVGVYDGGGNILLYIDGVLEATGTKQAGLVNAAASGVMTIGGDLEVSSFTYSHRMAHVAVYERALSAERILAQCDAQAFGFPQQTAGERIAEIADSILWSEAGIQTTGREVQPEMQFGQERLGEIAELAHAEGPRTLFYFAGDGGPQYRGHEWMASSSSYNTVQATFGNAGGSEVPFVDVELVTNDEFYNDVIVSHEAGETARASTGDEPLRTNAEWTDVLLMEHNEVESLAADVLNFYGTAQFRPGVLHLDATDSSARLQILSRQIGDMIRVKHRPRGGTVIDRICNIIGWEKHLERETGNLTCTWFLSRGFNAGQSPAVWHAGVVGFSEAGSTTIAG